MNPQAVSEWATQQRVIGLFQNDLGYDYLGDWQEREGNRNLEVTTRPFVDPGKDIPRQNLRD